LDHAAEVLILVVEFEQFFFALLLRIGKALFGSLQLLQLWVGRGVTGVTSEAFSFCTLRSSDELFWLGS
jgi:hypothetical protein